MWENARDADPADVQRGLVCVRKSARRVSSPDVTEISETVLAIRDAPSRLVLLVGPPGSGKSRHLRALSAEKGYPRVKINAILSEELVRLPHRRRPLHVRQILSDLLEADEEDVVLVDNIEVLFLPELRQEPLQLLHELARNRTLCVAWPGKVDPDGSLVYAEVGHAEHRRYQDHRTECIMMPGTL